MTRQETLRLAMKSARGAQVAPPLIVFQMPPATDPIHIILVLVGWMTIARVRPPMLPGPSHFQAAVLSPAVGGAAAGAASGPNGIASISSGSMPAVDGPSAVAAAAGVPGAGAGAAVGNGPTG